MKRLQVGDECYVRNGCGDLFKCRLENIHPGSIGEIEVFIHSMGCNQYLGTGDRDDNFKDNEMRYSLVYPYPCIKDLAK